MALPTTPEDRSRSVQDLLPLSAQAYQLAEHITGSHAAAEDAVQQAYLTAMEKLPPGMSQEGARLWFIKVTANAARKHLRSETRLKRREVAVPSENPEKRSPDAPPAELIAALRVALRTLDEELRLPLVLCYEQGMSQKSAAAVLDVSESTLSERVRRGLELMRRALARGGYTAAQAAIIGGLAHTALPAPTTLAASIGQLLLAGPDALAAGAAPGAGADVAQAPAHAGGQAAAGSGLAAKLTAGVLLAAAAVGAVTAVRSLVGPGGPPPGERRLYGFELGEAERLDRKLDGFILAGMEELPGGDYRFFTGTLEMSRAPFDPLGSLGRGSPMTRAGIQPWACVQEEASEGRHSLRVPNEVDPRGLNPLYCTPLASTDPVWTARPAANLYLPVLFQTAGWFRTAFPKDWSGHDCFRADVLVRGPYPGTVVVEVEDDLVDPPVSRTYGPIPPGEWVTLQLDLREAARERSLDLTSMRNVFVLFDGREHIRSARAEPGLDERVYLDSLRLCRREVPAARPVLKGEPSAYVRQLPRAYAVDVDWAVADRSLGGVPVVARDPAMPPPAPAPEAGLELKAASASTIDLEAILTANADPSRAEKTRALCGERVQLQAVSAYDEKHLLVGFGLDAQSRDGNALRLDKGRAWDEMLGDTALSPVCGLATSDGGATWTGLEGSPGPSLLVMRSGGSSGAQDAGADLLGLGEFGPHAMGASSFYTQGYPGDRVFFWRTVFTGGRWWTSPQYFVSSDPRGGAGTPNGGVIETSTGRLWAISYGPNRNFQPGEGPDYRDPEVPPSDRGPSKTTWAWFSDDRGATWQSWRGPGLSAAIPIHGRLVRCGDRVAVIGWSQWIGFDGREWSEPQPVKVHTGAVLGWGGDVYLMGFDGTAIRFDGRQWESTALPGGDGSFSWREARLSLCGDRCLLCIVPDGERRRLLVWRRERGADWSGPDEIASEGTPIVDMVAPRHAPDGFSPVAYRCRADEVIGEETPQGAGLLPWIRVLKVPSRAVRGTEPE